MTRPARFIDPHVHLWDLDHIHYSWLSPPFAEGGVMGSVEPIARNYLFDDYLADAEGWNVVGMVHVEAGADPEAALDESRWLQSIANERGMPNAIVAYAALDDPALEALLERHSGFSNMRGIRQIANWHPDPSKTYTPRDVIGHPQWQRGFALLSRYHLSFDFQLYPSQMGSAAALARRHPYTQMIINHAGMPIDPGEDGFQAWRAGMAAMAAMSSIATKISGFGIIDHRWSLESIRRLVLTAIDLFGVDRAMFASDFPTDKLFGSFDRHLSAYAAITSDFSADERDKLFAANAARLYRIDGFA